MPIRSSLNGVSDGTPVPIDTKTLNLVFKRARWSYVLSLIPHLIYRVVRPCSPIDETLLETANCDGIEGRSCRRFSACFPYLSRAEQSFAATRRTVAGKPHCIARLAACCTHESISYSLMSPQPHTWMDFYPHFALCIRSVL